MRRGERSTPIARARWEAPRRKARLCSPLRLIGLAAIWILVLLFFLFYGRNLEAAQPATEIQTPAHHLASSRRRNNSHHVAHASIVTRKGKDKPLPVSYVLTSFKDGAVLGDGLRLLVSVDAKRWSELPGSHDPVLPLSRLSKFGAKVFRDPSMVYAHGRFHLVFTSDLCVDQVPGHWKCRRHTKPRPVARFGYAHSRDLVKWEGVQLVKAPVKDACSLWAPEVSAIPAVEGGGLLVVFTVTQAAGLCPQTMRESHHTPYYVIARDYKHFSTPKPLELSKGESVIDMFPLLGGGGGGGQGGGDVDGGDDDGGADESESDGGNGGKHLLFYKAESNLCGPPYAAPLEWRLGAALHRNSSCSLVLRVARARKATGPWHFDASARGAYFADAISRPCVEGPTAVRALDGSWLLLFDNYRTDCILLAPRDDSGACVRVAGQPASAQGLRLSNRQAAASDEDGDGGGWCAYEPIRRGFGALRSTDLKAWVDVTGEVHAPEEHKHGTALRLTAKAWAQICDEPAGSPFERICFDRHRLKATD